MSTEIDWSQVKFTCKKPEEGFENCWLVGFTYGIPEDIFGDDDNIDFDSTPIQAALMYEDGDDDWMWANVGDAEHWEPANEYTKSLMENHPGRVIDVDTGELFYFPAKVVCNSVPESVKQGKSYMGIPYPYAEQIFMRGRQHEAYDPDNHFCCLDFILVKLEYIDLPFMVEAKYFTIL